MVSDLALKRNLQSDNGSENLRVVIVGNGPVGIRAMTDIFARKRCTEIILYGEEAHYPYDRVKLSSWLVGELSLDEISNRYRRPFGSSLDERFGQRVVSIDRKNKTVMDSRGKTTGYDNLILATGSHAYIPNIEGIHSAGVFTLRNINDANHLFARRNRSRHTVVLGGGLLGLEAAKSMQPANTRVTVVEHTDRLMANQLDTQAAAILRTTLESKGINFLIGDSLMRIIGEPRVTGVLMRSGQELSCDTVIVAAGIRPNIELARDAGLAFGRGIKVDNHLLTTDPSIYAIGECAEHKEEVYGMVAPGFEQASAVANHLTGSPGEYQGSVVASRLKVVGTPVFSVGPIGHTENPLDSTSITYHNKNSGQYRKLLFRHQKLVGAVAVGEWDQSVRVQSAIGMSARLHPWQKFRFKRGGNIWPENSTASVSTWPDYTVICQCNNVNKGTIASAIASGSNNVESIGQTCGAGRVCGSCKPQLQNLLGQQNVTPLIGKAGLLGLSLIAFLTALIILLAPPAQYAHSVQDTEILGLSLQWHWDTLWRSSLLKQISGYTILATLSLATLISIRKRIKKLENFGKFHDWRIAHLAFSVTALVALLFHTGFRMGYGLNFALMSLFVSLVLMGILTTTAMTAYNGGTSRLGTLTRQFSLRLHIYLFWPIPLLLGWHIFKGYWY